MHLNLPRRVNEFFSMMVMVMLQQQTLQ